MVCPDILLTGRGDKGGCKSEPAGPATITTRPDAAPIGAAGIFDIFGPSCTFFADLFGLVVGRAINPATEEYREYYPVAEQEGSMME